MMEEGEEILNGRGGETGNEDPRVINNVTHCGACRRPCAPPSWQLIRSRIELGAGGSEEHEVHGETSMHIRDGSHRPCLSVKPLNEAFASPPSGLHAMTPTVAFVSVPSPKTFTSRTISPSSKIMSLRLW